MTSDVNVTPTKYFLALDVGEKRIGLARGDDSVKLAYPIGFIEVDGEEIAKISKEVEAQAPSLIVVGYPRNQSGEETKQTEFVKKFSQTLSKKINIKIVFQDESLTSVLAEDKLRKTKPNFKKGDIDALSATIILQDFLEKNYGH